MPKTMKPGALVIVRLHSIASDPPAEVRDPAEQFVRKQTAAEAIVRSAYINRHLRNHEHVRSRHRCWYRFANDCSVEPDAELSNRHREQLDVVAHPSPPCSIRDRVAVRICRRT